MTATPRIYGSEARAIAERDNVALYSMDNEAWYGKQLFVTLKTESRVVRNVQTAPIRRVYDRAQ